MEKPAIPGKNLPWAGKKVRPEQVEDELTFLWRLAADNMRISQNMKVRTSVLNLIICTSDPQSAYQIRSLLRDLPNTHIARVILLILDQSNDAPTEVATWVTLRSFPVISDIMRHHFEQVTVRLSGAAIQSSSTIVQSLLKQDLPIYLWWTADFPTDLTIFHHLISISNRAIIDSSDFSRPIEHVCALPALVQQVPTCALSDFNWCRLSPWREMVAQFSDVADYLPYLVNVERVEIEHAVLPGGQPGEGKDISPSPVRALFLAAWIKTRLNWQRYRDPAFDCADASTGTYRWRMKTVTGPMQQPDGAQPGAGPEIVINPRPQVGLRPGNICLFRAIGVYGGKRAVFTINREADVKHVTTWVELPGATYPSRTVNMAATQKESDLLSDELEIMRHDQLYEEILREVFALLTQ